MRVAKMIELDEHTERELRVLSKRRRVEARLQQRALVVLLAAKGLQNKDIAGVSGEAMARLMEHDFPGNVRELENIIEQAFVLSRGGLIELHHLPPELRPAASGPAESLNPISLQAMEALMITEVLRRHQGNRRRAAKDLGIDASTLYRKIKSLRIDVPEIDGRTRRK